jgi:hypothetical protein
MIAATAAMTPSTRISPPTAIPTSLEHVHDDSTTSLVLEHVHVHDDSDDQT